MDRLALTWTLRALLAYGWALIVAFRSSTAGVNADPHFT
jgi:hypothetical protein